MQTAHPDHSRPHAALPTAHGNPRYSPVHAALRPASLKLQGRYHGHTLHAGCGNISLSAHPQHPHKTSGLTYAQPAPAAISPRFFTVFQTVFCKMAAVDVFRTKQVVFRRFQLQPVKRRRRFHTRDRSCIGREIHSNRASVLHSQPGFPRKDRLYYPALSARIPERSLSHIPKRAGSIRRKRQGAPLFIF